VEAEESFIDVLPGDVLEVIVRAMIAQPRRPEAVVALTSTCWRLFLLRPAQLQKESARDRVSFALDSRPSTSELHQRGIMKGSPGVSVSLTLAREALRREMTKDAMNHSLDRRPPASQLHERGIMKGAPGMSAGLVATSEVLQREITKISVAASLRHLASLRGRAIEAGHHQLPTASGLQRISEEEACAHATNAIKPTELRAHS